MWTLRYMDVTLVYVGQGVCGHLVQFTFVPVSFSVSHRLQASVNPVNVEQSSFDPIHLVSIQAPGA